jgi:hypothetical protein
MPVIRGNGSGWLRRLLQQGGFLPHPNHRINRCALEFPFITLHPSKDPCNLLTSYRGKQKQAAPPCLPVPVTGSKGRWELVALACSFYFLIPMSVSELLNIY